MARVIVRNAIVGACTLAACVASATSAVGQPVTFTDHIRPIMERSCWNCHGEAAQRSDLDLRTRESAMQGGTRGPAIVPGRAEESRLYRTVAGLDDPPMPMSGNGLTEGELAAVRDWINEGAHWDASGTPTAADALSALENSELPPGARDYWAFRLAEQTAVPPS